MDLVPFAIQHQSLRKEILKLAVSWHVRPSRFIITVLQGSRQKTTLLKLLGQELLERNQVGYLFKNARDLDLVRANGEQLMQNTPNQEAYFSLWTRRRKTNVDSIVFAQMLLDQITKSPRLKPVYLPLHRHLARLPKGIPTSRLYKNDNDLVKDGVNDFFPINVSDPSARNEISKLMRELRCYVGGHVYALMRLSELLMPTITNFQRNE